MKKHAFALLTAVMMFAATTQAQNGNDVIYLRDGSMYRGTVIEKVAGSHVKIMTPDGQTKQFPIDEVAKMNMVGTTEPFEFKPVGYVNATSIGLLMGLNEYGAEARPSFQTVNGVTIGQKWQVGLGTGLEAIRSDWNIPVFADGRYHLGKGEVSPYVGLQAGYLVPLPAQQRYYYDFAPYEPDKRKGGVMIGSEIGIRNVVKKHFGYNVSLGYRFQTDTRETTRYFWNGTGDLYLPVTERTMMHRVCLRVGLLFN